MSKIKLTGCGLFILTLLLSYQNCSQPYLLQSTGSSLFPKSENGGTYTGIKEGHFFQFVPDFTCEKIESVVADIKTSVTGSLLTENSKLKCGYSKKDIPSTDIDYSIFQEEIIGYKESIFEGRSQTPTSIPADLVEVWCRDKKDETGIETIMHYDRVKKTAFNKIYYATKNSGSNSSGYTYNKIPDFPVSRVVSQYQVVISDGNGFSLVVERNIPAAQSGLFVGHLEAVIEGQKISRETSCRVGGLLDPTVWPAKQIVDFDVAHFEMSPDKNFFAYTSSDATGTGVKNLYNSYSDGTNQIQVSPPMQSVGVLDFSYDPFSLFLTYLGDPRLGRSIELFKIALDGRNPTQMGAQIPSQLLSVESGYRFTTDSSYTVFKDGSDQILSNGELFDSSGYKWLKSYSHKDGVVKTLNPPLRVGLDQGVNNFDISNTKKRVAYLVGNIFCYLYSANLDGTDIKNITPPGIAAMWSVMDPFPGINDSTFDWFTQVNVPNGGDYVVVKARKMGVTRGGYYGTYYLMAIDGSSYKMLPDNWALESINPSGTHALLINRVPSIPEYKLMNIQTGATFDIPTLYSTGSAYFSQDSKSLFAISALAGGGYQPISMGLSDGSVRSPCSGVVSDLVALKEYEKDKHLILAYNKKNKILDVYTSSFGGCAKVNSAIVTRSSALSTVTRGAIFFSDVIVSPDKQKVLVGLDHQILYIPLNGKPSYIVNTPVDNRALIWDFKLLNDSRTVIFWGDQVRPGKKNIFKWIAPAD